MTAGDNVITAIVSDSTGNIIYAGLQYDVARTSSTVFIGFFDITHTQDWNEDLSISSFNF